MIACRCVSGSQQGQRSKLCTEMQSTQPLVTVELYVLLLNLPKTLTNANTTTQTLLDRLPRLCLPRDRGNYSDMLSEHIRIHREGLRLFFLSTIKSRSWQ